MIYLDNAATTLHKPKEVQEAVIAAFGQMGNSGRGASEPALKALGTVYDAREALARLFHAENAALAFICRSKTGEDLTNAVTGKVYLLDCESRNDFFFHGFDTIKVCTVLRRQKHLGRREMHLRNAWQVGKALPGEIFERQRVIETVFQ